MLRTPRPAPRAIITAATALAVAAGGAVAVAPSASAAPVLTPLFQATASGTAVSAVGGAVTSGPTSPVAIRTRSTTQKATNQTASVGVPGVLTSGEIATDTSTRRNTADTATIVRGHARTAGVNLLGGTLTLGAVDTSAQLTVSAKKVTATTRTSFANLRITGQKVINGTVPANTTIEVPGVAKIILNASGSVNGTTSGMAVSTGIIVTVLGGTAAGTTIAINPTTAQTQRVSPYYAPLSGLAVGAAVTVDGDASLNAGPLGAIGMPDTGTQGQTISANLADATLPGAITAAGLTATANGVASNAGSRSTMTSTVTGLNVFNGLITASALTARAEVRLRSDGTFARSSSVTFTGLTIAGVPVPLDAAPGLALPLPGVGGVLIRGTANADNAAGAVGLTINLTTAAFGLPAGATVQIGFAYAAVNPV